MNITEIKELIAQINDSSISLFELKLDNNYLKMDKSDSRNSAVQSHKVEENKDVVKEEPTVNANIPVASLNTEAASQVVEKTTEDLYTIKSPMVGTFYEAPGTELDAFVKVGDSIKEGDTLCIIEAMKLMNELESDVSGEIVEIVAKNGEMVEFGEPLFKVRRN